ncbi:UNVERIFIED_CONTAM: hypothetical protein GTU68_037666 [Idotea baltica]|nr:hypothetical protein [Idotea baltica]
MLELIELICYKDKVYILHL